MIRSDKNDQGGHLKPETVALIKEKLGFMQIVDRNGFKVSVGQLCDSWQMLWVEHVEQSIVLNAEDREIAEGNPKAAVHLNADF